MINPKFSDNCVHFSEKSMRIMGKEEIETSIEKMHLVLIQ